MTVKIPAKLAIISEIALCAVRKWWRPLVCISMGLALLVNGVVIPLITRTVPDLTGLAALCVALSPFAWLRTKEKIKGATEGPL